MQKHGSEEEDRESGSEFEVPSGEVSETAGRFRGMLKRQMLTALKDHFPLFYSRLLAQLV